MLRFSLGRRCLVARVPGRQLLVALEQGGGSLLPVRRPHGADLAAGPRLEPEGEQLVGEGVPDGERLAHRGDPGVLAATVERLPRRPDGFTEDDRGLDGVATHRCGQEAQAVGEGRQLLGEPERGLVVALADKPDQRQERRLLGNADVEAPAGQPGGEVLEAGRGEQVVEKGPAGPREIRAAHDLELLGLERPLRRSRCGGEAAAHHLGRDPGGQVVHRGSRADGQPAAGHPAQDRAPLGHPAVRPLACGRVLVVLSRLKRPGELAEHVARIDLHVAVAASHIQHGGLCPRALRVSSPVLC